MLESVTLVVGLIATLMVVTLGLETIENKPERTIDEKVSQIMEFSDSLWPLGDIILYGPGAFRHVGF